MLQIYGGIDSHFLAGFPMSSEMQLPQTMEDFIRHHGAMSGLMSDNAKSEISKAIGDYMRAMAEDRLHEQAERAILSAIRSASGARNTTSTRMNACCAIPS